MPIIWKSPKVDKRRSTPCYRFQATRSVGFRKDDHVKITQSHRDDNADYEGPYPAAEYYAPDTMSSKKCEIFFNWHNEVSITEKFNMRREIVSYCIHDVTVLRLACVKFRQIFLDCVNLCPFTKNVTLAGSLAYACNFLKDNLIGLISNEGYVRVDRHSQKAVEWLLWVEQQLKQESSGWPRERVLSYDTDSIIYVSKGERDEYEPETGTLLGQLTDELEECGEGSYIETFVPGGPKFYAYRVRAPNGETFDRCKGNTIIAVEIMGIWLRGVIEERCPQRCRLTDNGTCVTLIESNEESGIYLLKVRFLVLPSRAILADLSHDHLTKTPTTAKQNSITSAGVAVTDVVILLMLLLTLILRGTTDDPDDDDDDNDERTLNVLSCADGFFVLTGSAGLAAYKPQVSLSFLRIVVRGGVLPSKSSSRLRIHIASCEASARAIYSTSVDDNATHVCFLHAQLIDPP
ncbi:hypothetical protein TSAR_016430 [Trichomalopsis sarcophagae]|uniref:DNA-directed DNA polymerase n=1 Tax=Trichomalopsis sarcophagae TaxID=543379 RepID=A0A232EVW0_9HYME|nr:hypothetical protein TSAR_016430 [Trichomalopsis sarcophagae]